VTVAMTAALKSAAALLLSGLLLCLLGGCAAGTPAGMADAAPDRLPIIVPCIVARPVAPFLPRVPRQGIFAQTQALLAREHLRAAYVQQLEALIDGCAGG